MAFALFLLGLLPLVFLGDFGSADPVAVDGEADEDSGDDSSVETGDGDFLEFFGGTHDGGGETGGTQTTGLAPGAAGDVVLDPVTEDEPPVEDDLIDPGSVLDPVTEDEPPVEGDPVDPGSVLDPVTEDEPPVEGDPVDPDTVLDPNEDPADEFPIDGDGTFLQQALLSETDATTGVGYLGTRIGEGDSTDTALTAGDDTLAEPDDGVDGTGEGTLDSWDGTPILNTPGDLRVISGGDGNDNITTGDAAAYAFGGAGDDTLAAGEGVAALFGGEGDDTLTGTDTGATAWLDGGHGNDTIIGGAAGEVIDGGAHAEGDAGVQDDDTIDGGGGDDIIRGGYGADTLLGGDGNDVIDHLGRAEQRIVWSQSEFGWHIDNEADTLDGGAGDDTLIMDRADTATGGEGADTFWVYFDEVSGAGAAEVTDFQPGEDFLRVTLNPELGLGDPTVTVGPSDDGADGVVTVNGNVIAILRGVPEASENDVYAEVVDNTYV